MVANLRTGITPDVFCKTVCFVKLAARAATTTFRFENARTAYFWKMTNHHVNEEIYVFPILKYAMLI